ncbi:MAG: hypothetical protein JST92_09340 [Deltaproteobacteria bacterium]|nr:hypothetical protein [Deltaproteobacteria bacterium]
MHRMTDDLQDLRTAPEQLARWALETPPPVQEATFSALAFLARTFHATAAQLPAAEVLLTEAPIQDSDGFSRIPREAIELFRARTVRAAAWLEQLAFFRERFPTAAARVPSPQLFALAKVLASHADAVEAATDVLVRESVLPEIEELIQRALTYPPLQTLLLRLREGEAARSAEARKVAASVIGELTGQKLWRVRRRLLASAARAVLASRPLLAELERAGLKVDRARAAKGFARRLEESVGGLAGKPVIPAALVNRLTSAIAGDEPSEPPHT